MADGQIEFMIHRRILSDDGSLASALNPLRIRHLHRFVVFAGRGVGEPLNETDGHTPYPDFKR